MKRVIYKFKLMAATGNRIVVPIGSNIIEIAYQGDDLCVWMSVFADHINQPDLLVVRSFHVIATGRVFDDTDTKFVKTVFTGPFVFHVFEAL